MSTCASRLSGTGDVADLPLAMLSRACSSRTTEISADGTSPWDAVTFVCGRAGIELRIGPKHGSLPCLGRPPFPPGPEAAKQW